MARGSKFMAAALAGASLFAASCGSSSSSKDVTGTTAIATATTAAPTTAAVPVVTDAPKATEPVETTPPTEAAEKPTASDTGITQDTIKIGVAIADLAAVRAAGISIPETLTSEHLFDRWNVYAKKWNDAGGINGRTVEFVQLLWDPLNPKSFDTLCASATVDQELFMVLNGTGLSSVAMNCLADAGMLMMYGDVVAQDLLDTGLMISLPPPAEVVSVAGVEAWIKSGQLAAPAKVGVLSSNTPLIQAAGKAAETALKDAGYDVQVIETNSLAGDNAATNEEGAAAVGTFLANGVQHAFVATPFTENKGFWNAAADSGKLPYTLLDTAASQCSAFGLSRAPAEAAGSLCATAFDQQGIEGKGVRADTPFEAECRKFYDANYTAYFGSASSPGVPSGQKIPDVNGKVLSSDFAPQECTIANLLEQGLKNGGVNPTRKSVHDAILALGEQPFALGSDGTGTLKADKPYLADKVHTVRVTLADPKVVPGADGTYNGCPAPVTCGVVISDWTPIA